MMRPVVGKAKQWARLHRGRSNLLDRWCRDSWPLGRRCDVLAIRDAPQIRLKIVRPEIKCALVRGCARDEGELSVGQLAAQRCQCLQAMLFAEIGRDQAAVVKVEHAMCSAPGQ